MSNTTQKSITWKTTEIDPNLISNRVVHIELDGSEHRYLIQMPDPCPASDKPAAKKRHKVTAIRKVISALHKEYQGTLGASEKSCEIVFSTGLYESTKLFEGKYTQALTKHNSHFVYDLSEEDFARMTVLSVHELSFNPGRREAPYYNARSKLIRKILSSLPCMVNQKVRSFWHPAVNDGPMKNGLYLDVLVPADIHKKISS